MNKYLIAIVGPTAIGKTALSIKIAQQYNTEILSADSRQFFKEMYIGTAVPEPDEIAAAPHHFIQHLSVDDPYSVGQFEKDAISKIKQLHLQHDKLVMVGGSGMYVDAVINGLDDFPKVKPGIRDQLQELFKSEGVVALQNLLFEKDPEYYRIVDISNAQRIIRALEVCLSSGNSFSSYRNKPRTQRDFQTIKLGLSADREVIYERINKRVDIMIANGLVEEVRSLLSRKHNNALITVGYREIFEYFEGKVTLERAIENIKTNTRRFAKRQLTWYRRDESIKWFDYKTPLSEIISFLNTKTHR
ncbi:tRNA (adenosine(37)-N6)-dimethylallyltransferase MiaA [Dokdonia sp. Hel_I_53]|uniref:tRNA (adenosine(37)-N6)-dimethylallyltransferase MiaA n=1 Tax=Dokdonia sp. Hel_I_53 TaxID=1566287 RepID=UPI00119A84E9|nr:tRNA (adenosine(37)-N6)-dimethylallyltransferase MiaA [Dokdonia sp. Hel_I_53]TVZ53277.1 tRNA dimethylallyltransferase [Dokdonia sp. Hel_I_53]